MVGNQEDFDGDEMTFWQNLNQQNAPAPGETENQ